MKPSKGKTIIEADPETIGTFGICGYKNPKRPGYLEKLEWFRRRFKEGMKVKVLVRTWSRP